MNIGGVPIGPGNPTYLIAEVGSNHDGSLDRAFELIRHAANAGADCAKFQLYRADKLYPGTVTEGAIPDEWLPELKAACHEAGVEFMCSVFCEETLDAYMTVDPAAVKIASPEATNTDLLRSASCYRVPLLVSTGALQYLQVAQLRLFLLNQRCEFALLHCVSSYPPPLDELNLRAIADIATPTGFPYPYPVGFSDHSLLTGTVPMLAVACGASIIEKHLTYDRGAAGPDHPFALEPDEFAVMVEGIRAAEVVLGDGVKRVQPSEDATDRRAA